MSYSAEISRSNPTCFVFLVDQSGSMSDSFGGESGKSKADGVADAVNRLLQTLVFRCAKGENVLDRYFIGVVGYGASVGSGFQGKLLGEGLVPVSRLGSNPLRVEKRTKKAVDGAGGLVELPVKFPVWFESVAENGTPMCEAIRLAGDVVAEFIGRCSTCFPPIVINITDGEATDGDPEPAAAVLRGLSSRDGGVLLFNIHISDKSEKPIQFPAKEVVLPDEHACRLFRMSSVLPPVMIAQANGMGIAIEPGGRGFVFNGDLVSVIQFLDIGTRVDAGAR